MAETAHFNFYCLPSCWPTVQSTLWLLCSDQIPSSQHEPALCVCLGDVAAADVREHLWCRNTFFACLTVWPVVWNFTAVWLLASGGPEDSPTVSKHPSHTVADGHHLGRCQLTEGLPAQHAGPALHAGLEVGLFHQPQRHRFSHQVGPAE